MEIYFQALARTLDKERPQWRSGTVIMLDNASYHASKSTQAVLEKLQIPVLYTGPHSYAASPIELFFSAFKSQDINPRKIPTGKKHFQQIAELATARVKEIPVTHRILFWHHCQQHLYRYLTL